MHIPLPLGFSPSPFFDFYINLNKAKRAKIQLVNLVYFSNIIKFNTDFLSLDFSGGVRKCQQGHIGGKSHCEYRRDVSVGDVRSEE